MWGDDEQAVKDLMLSSSSSRVMERALKEFLMTMEVTGDGLHLSRVVLAELKKGADLAVSKKTLSVVS